MDKKKEINDIARIWISTSKLDIASFESMKKGNRRFQDFRVRNVFGACTVVGGVA